MQLGFEIAESHGGFRYTVTLLFDLDKALADFVRRESAIALALPMVPESANSFKGFVEKTRLVTDRKLRMARSEILQFFGFGTRQKARRP